MMHYHHLLFLLHYSLRLHFFHQRHLINLHRFLNFHLFNYYFSNFHTIFHTNIKFASFVNFFLNYQFLPSFIILSRSILFLNDKEYITIFHLLHHLKYLKMFIHHLILIKYYFPKLHDLIINIMHSNFITFICYYLLILSTNFPKIQIIRH